MTEITVTLRGQPYLVKTDEAGTVRVFTIITRSPVSRNGNYQQDTFYRTIKPGSANFRAATKAASL